MLPGDMCDLNCLLPRRLDHTLEALTHAQVALIPLDRLLVALDASASLRRDMAAVTVVAGMMLREWLVTVGSRPTDKGLLHLLCEFHARLDSVGWRKTAPSHAAKPEGSWSGARRLGRARQSVF